MTAMVTEVIASKVLSRPSGVVPVRSEGAGAGSSRSSRLDAFLIAFLPTPTGS